MEDVARPFCGREDELAVLTDAFAAIRGANAGPRLLVLCGESGVGKTRIVQQFYHWLATRHDAPGEGGYWPDRIGDAVNPPGPCNPGGAADLRFLWLGVACRIHNDGLEDLATLIAPHMAAIEAVRAKRLWAQDIGKDVAKTALAAIPVIGPLLEKAGDYGGRFRKFGKVWLEPDRAEGDAPASARATERVIGEDVDSIVNCFADLLDMPQGATDMAAATRALDRKLAGQARIPAILVIDDAQRLAINPAKQRLIETLLRTARERNWPLLVIATHWQREWLEEDGREGSFAHFAGNWARAADPAWAPLAIGIQPPHLYEPLLVGLLPGLTEAQRAALAARAGGNPRIIAELAAYAHEAPRLFHGLDSNAALTDAGLDELLGLEIELGRLIRRRLNAAPAGVRAAASLSAVQGMEFLGELTMETARLMGVEGDETVIRALVDPHALASADPSGLYAFAQLVFREAALSNLPNIFADPTAPRAMLERVVRERVDDAVALEAMPRARRNALRRVALSILADLPNESPRRAALLLQLAGDAASRHDYVTAMQRYDDALAEPAGIGGLDQAAAAPDAAILVPAFLDMDRPADARIYTGWRLAAYKAGLVSKKLFGFTEFEAAYQDINARDGLGMPAEWAEMQEQNVADAQAEMLDFFEKNPGTAEILFKMNTLDSTADQAMAAGDWEGAIAAFDAKLAMISLDPFMPAVLRQQMPQRDRRLQAMANAVLVARGAGGPDDAVRAAEERLMLAALMEISLAQRYAESAGAEDSSYPSWSVRRHALDHVRNILRHTLPIDSLGPARTALPWAEGVCETLLAERRGAHELYIVGVLEHLRAVLSTKDGNLALAYEQQRRAIELTDESLELDAEQDNADTRGHLCVLLGVMAEIGATIGAPDSSEWTNEALNEMRALPAEVTDPNVLQYVIEFLFGAVRASLATGGLDIAAGLLDVIQARVDGAPERYAEVYRAQIMARIGEFRGACAG